MSSRTWASMLLSSLAAIMVATACSVPPPDGVNATPSESMTSSPVPGESLETDVRAAVTSVMRSMSVPGVVVNVSTPDAHWEQGFGVRRFGDPQKPQTTDTFRVGSITKTMVGTVAMQLVSEGRLGLDDTVSRFRTDVPDGDAITIGDLLDMRSGLYSYTEDPRVAEEMDADPQRAWEPEELLAIAFGHEPYSAPGEHFRYSNTNTVLLATILQTITGQSVEKLVTDRVINPLGLRHTRFTPADDRTPRPPQIHGYLYGTNVSALASTVLADDRQQAIRSGRERPTDVTSLDPSWIWAAGAVVSDAEDIARYAVALTDGELLNRSTQQQRLASTGAPEQNPSVMTYGYGIAAFGPLYGHDGAIPGYQSFMGRDPVRGITVVVLCSVRDGPGGGRPANEIAYEIMRGLYRG